MTGQKNNPFWHPSFGLAGALLVGLSLLLVGCSGFFSPGGVISETPTPPARADLQIPGLVELVDANLTPPEIPTPPGQLDIGAEIYFQICLACHGDWGQGLTDEWRATWGEDQNCWQSKCHAANHPPWGFELVRTIPPVLGAGSISRFQTAEDLYFYIADTMPWWNPGSLSVEEAWAVTAYLMQRRGEIPDGITLDPGNAPIIRLHAPVTKPKNDTPQALLLVVTLTLAFAAFTMIKKGSG